MRFIRRLSRLGPRGAAGWCRDAAFLVNCARPCAAAGGPSMAALQARRALGKHHVCQEPSQAAGRYTAAAAVCNAVVRDAGQGNSPQNPAESMDLSRHLSLRMTATQLTLNLKCVRLGFGLIFISLVLSKSIYIVPALTLFRSIN